MRQAASTIIAVASGKGGTGKTTVAAHLALAAAMRAGSANAVNSEEICAAEPSAHPSALLVDLDVEAPDASAYFPDAEQAGKPSRVAISVPRLIEARCSGCGYCAAACRFGAIIAIGGVVSVDLKACKGCGRCVEACPTGALEERRVEVGSLRTLSADGLMILEGAMDVGDIRSTAVIEAAKRHAAEAGAITQIRDCPPGVSCPATHATAGADYLVLVAEPTAFSLHDLEEALKLAESRGVPTGVVVNKAGFGDADVEGACRKRGVPVIGRIAFSESRAAAGARAETWRGEAEAHAEFGRILDAALKASAR